MTSNVFQKSLKASPEVSQDLMMVAAVMADTHDHPLPIEDPD
jgi:hypothetical protein